MKRKKSGDDIIDLKWTSAGQTLSRPLNRPCRQQEGNLGCIFIHSCQKEDNFSH